MNIAKVIWNSKALSKWGNRGWSDFAPQFVKEKIFEKYALPDAIWIETGTFRGKTTRFLSRLASQVYTIEAAEKYYENARKRFSGTNVKVLHGLSEEVMPGLLPGLSGDICFWLDGHFSAGDTFEGAKHCPVEDELDCIAQNMGQFSRVSILIDDVRCFLPSETSYRDYPTLDFLVDWCRTHGFEWRIEQDIFIARNWT